MSKVPPRTTAAIVADLKTEAWIFTTRNHRSLPDLLTAAAERLESLEARIAALEPPAPAPTADLSDAELRAAGWTRNKVSGTPFAQCCAMPSEFWFTSVSPHGGWRIYCRTCASAAVRKSREAEEASPDFDYSGGGCPGHEVENG